MLTDEYTFQYGVRGSLLNGDPIQPTDCFVDIDSVSGLDSVEVRATSHDREGQDGGFLDAAFEKMRTIVLEGTIFNCTEDFLDRLKGEYGPTTTPQAFFFKAPGQLARFVNAKSLGVRYKWESLRRIGSVKIQIQLQAEDPTIQGELITGQATLAGAESGFGFDMEFDFGFGDGTASAPTLAHMYNAGNKPADCSFRITGPVTDPSIAHETSGNTLAFDIDLTDTDYLDINLRNKTVRLNDSANRRGSMTNTSRWFLLLPGANVIRFDGESSGSPQLTCTARSAYR